MAVDAVAAATAAQTTKAKNTLSGNFDTFLRLLTTQLQYQDPLEPLDSTKFTEQLVSYSQVEQQINTNSNLETLLALSKAAASQTAVNYLGKMALTAGDKTGLDDGAANWRYALPGDAASVQLTITDVNGKPVYTLPGEKTVGLHEFAWDGKNSAGTTLPPGTYGLLINARKADGTSLTSTVTGVGLVKEIDMSGATPVLSVSGRIIGVDEILGFKS
jgi:flagellar basal-body rod modification protein FlgD